MLYIREMQHRDIPEVVKIERMSFTTPWSETSFYSEIHNRSSIALVAESDSVIVGYICARHFNEECHLLNLAVHPDYRRQGIATILLQEVIQELRDETDCYNLYLEVRISNYASRKLYEKFGFRIVGIRKNYYVFPTEDAVIMMKEI